MNDNVVEIFHFLSMWSNPIVYFSCVLVLIHYGSTAYKSLFASLFKGENMSLADALIIGISIAFLGEIIDNCFWNGAWSAYEQKDGSHHKWMTYGPISNIIFRQWFIIISSMFHVYPSMSASEDRKLTFKEIIMSAFIALFLFGFMSFLGSNL